MGNKIKYEFLFNIKWVYIDFLFLWEIYMKTPKHIRPAIILLHNYGIYPILCFRILFEIQDSFSSSDSKYVED